MTDENVEAHSGWTIDQQLEKARYDAMPHLSNVTCNLLAIMLMLPEEGSTRSEFVQKMSIFLIDRDKVSHEVHIKTHVLDEKHDDVNNDDALINDEDQESNGKNYDTVRADNREVSMKDEKHTSVDRVVPESAFLFPQPPKKTLGRPPRAKLPLISNGAPLAIFLDECFTLDPDSKTLTALVKARHRLWRRSNLKEHTTELCTFFDLHFQNVKEIDVEHHMTSSYYKGISLKEWVPSEPSIDVFHDDVDAFLREKCEVHVMGRVRTDNLLSSFLAWKGSNEAMTHKERQRVLKHVESSFFRSMVPINKTAECGPGFFGLYLKSASDECREVGYNRSPNTRSAVLKLDSQGTVLTVYDSLQEFATNVIGKSNAYVCNQLTKCFADGMSGLVHTDGFSYMRCHDFQIRKLRATSSPSDVI